MTDKSHSFVVIGLGAFGATVASELARFGNYVTGVDLDEKRAAAMGDALSQTVILDATEEGALREAGIDHHDAGVVAIGDNIEASILAALNLKLLGVGRIWAKASSKSHHRILTRIGVDRVLLAEQEMGRHAAQMLHNPSVRDYVSLGNGFHIVTIDAPESLDGKTFDEIDVGGRFDLRPLGLMRGKDFHDCPGDFAVAKGDKLLILGKRAELRRFGDAL